MIIIFFRKAFLTKINVKIWIAASVVLEANDDFAVVAINFINIILVHTLFNYAVNAPLREKNLNVNVRN